MEQRQDLIDIFLDMNTKLNLSAIRDAEGVYNKHIRDSLELTKFDIIKPGNKVMDVGTGGGFPLMALAMHYPETQFTGLDSTKKKVDAVNTMMSQAGISNAKALRGRAEEHKNRYDVVTARAVAYADKLIPWVYNLIKSEGYLVLYKPESPDEEYLIEDLCDEYGMILAYTHSYSLFDGDITRMLYVIKKE